METLMLHPKIKYQKSNDETDHSLYDADTKRRNYVSLT